VLIPIVSHKIILLYANVTQSCDSADRNSKWSELEMSFINIIPDARQGGKAGGSVLIVARSCDVQIGE
jgi:hypothetical protein